MLSAECRDELQSAWLPNMTDAGLDRLVELLEKSSPLLIHGCFTRALPMGCLATHVAWHHPHTQHLTLDAGITWLHHVAGLNPATSHVLREWDRRGLHDWELREDLLSFFQQARRDRQSTIDHRHSAKESAESRLPIVESRLSNLDCRIPIVESR